MSSGQNVIRQNGQNFECILWKQSFELQIIFSLYSMVSNYWPRYAKTQYKSTKDWSWQTHEHWGNRTKVAAATIVSMAAAKKGQQNVFASYHSYNRTILLGFIWILDFHFKIVLAHRRRNLIPMRCNNGNRKMCPWRWLHHFEFQHWRWLYALMTMVALLRAGIFSHTQSRSPADKYAYRLYDCCQVWYV